MNGNEEPIAPKAQSTFPVETYKHHPERLKAGLPRGLQGMLQGLAEEFVGVGRP